MRFKQLLTKSLLVAAGLCVGANSAWADWTTLYSNDYETESSISDICSGDYRDCYITDATNHYLKIREAGRNGGSKTLTFPSYTTTTYSQYQLSFKVGFNTSNSKGSSFQLRNGSTALATFAWGTWNAEGAVVSYTIGSTKQAESLTAVIQDGKTRNSDTNNTITKWYTFTITGSEDAGDVKLTVNDGSSNVIENSVISATYVTLSSLYLALGNAHAEIGFDDMLLKVYSDVEVVPNPSAAITGVNGKDRTVTMTLGTGSPDGTVIKYYTDTESKSDLTTYSAPFTVSSTSTIYYYAESTSGTKSGEKSINVTCEAITLNTPVISRTANNTVTISDNQSGLDGSPTTTIYYTYGGDPVAYSGPITVAADATITAYATATGYTNSANTSRAVALFPEAGVTQTINAPQNNTYSSASLTGDDVTGTNATFKALTVDGEQWGGANVFVQSTNFGYRNGGSSKDWYINNTSDTWILIKNMKAGDIIVANTSYQASNLTNASYTEKYSISNSRAYTVTADGDVELAFKKPNSKTMHYFYGLYAYTHSVTGTAIGATDCSTAWKAATTTPVTLKPGDSYRYQFINYNNGANINDQNWQLIVANAANSADLLQIRADWYENLHGSTDAEHQRGFTSDGDWWSIVPSKMNGAEVDMTVTFTADKKFVMTSTTTGSDGTTTRTYDYTSDNANSIDLTANDALTVYLTVANNWLDITDEKQTAVGITPDYDNSTYCSAYDLDFSAVDGLKAYIAASGKVDNSITLSSVDQIKAGEGMVLVGTAETTYSVPVTTVEEAPATNYMKGVLVDTPLDANSCYILGTDGDFHPVSGGTLAAGKAYLDISPSGAKSLNIMFDNETLGINDASLLNKNAEGMGEKTIYNLSGQRIAAPQKGINIIGGRKVVVK